jgi:hypothetical protein
MSSVLGIGEIAVVKLFERVNVCDQMRLCPSVLNNGLSLPFPSSQRRKASGE